MVETFILNTIVDFYFTKTNMGEKIIHAEKDWF